MADNALTISGSANVEFKAVAPLLEREIKRFKSIFPNRVSAPARTAMS
jgi:hypothetical protein